MRTVLSLTPQNWHTLGKGSLGSAKACSRSDMSSSARLFLFPVMRCVIEPVATCTSKMMAVVFWLPVQCEKFAAASVPWQPDLTFAHRLQSCLRRFYEAYDVMYDDLKFEN